MHSAVKFSMNDGGGSTVYPIDAAGVSPLIAIDLRKLRKAYSGACVNVRRSSDNTTKDIGFTAAGNLDIATASAFASGGNLFIAKQYDQSGNGNDLSNGTNANQPQLVLSVAALNGKPGILYGDASAFALGSASIATSVFGAGGFALATINLLTITPTATDRIFSHGSAIQFAVLSTARLRLLQSATASGTWQSVAMSLGAHVVGCSYNSSALANVPSMPIDGVTSSLLVSTQPTGTITAEGGSVFVGNSVLTGGVLGFAGHIPALMVFTAIPSAPAILSLTNAQRKYYGTP